MYICIKLFGWIGGFFGYLLLLQTIQKMLKRMLNLEMMNATDEMFWLDDERSYGNIICYLKFDKTDVVKYGETIMKRARIFPRLKSRIVKFLGYHMFQEMDDDEYHEATKSQVEYVDDVKDLD